MTTCKIVDYPSENDWLKIRNDFLVSQRKTSKNIPSSELKMKYFASEHTPIYGLQFTWEWQDLPSWVSVHFVRHHIGVHHIVSSQRNDIQYQYDRRKAPQDAKVNHRSVGNAGAIMNIAQKRQCFTASSETRNAWNLFMNELKIVCPELALFCVKPCVYRGGICPEIFSKCRYNTSEPFKKELTDYVELYERLKTKE